MTPTPPSLPPLPPPALPRSVPATAAAYRMLWRWHFYAGLFVMPFLIVLAVTGTIYCFQPQIEPLLYPHLLRVKPAGQPLGADALLQRARAAAPDGAVATTYAIPARPDASTEFVFRLPSGHSDSVYLDPYSGEILGSLSVENRLMKQVRMIHRALLAGKPGELLMELAGCWTLVMIATGLAMWWPRLRASGLRAWVRAPAAGKRGVERTPSGAGRLAGARCAGLCAVRIAVDGVVGPAVQGSRHGGESGTSRRRPGRATACDTRRRTRGT